MIQAAEELVIAEERKATARKQLLEACTKCTKAALAEAIEIAKEAKLDATEYANAEELLKKEEEKERLFAEVQALLEESKKADMTSIDAVREAKAKLGDAIMKATELGVPEVDLTE